MTEFGDQTLAVSHLVAPRRDTVMGRVLLALGLLMMIFSARSVAVAQDAIERDRASRQAWMRDHGSLRAWRPERIGRVHDWIALGGAAAGLVLLILGHARTRRRRWPCRFCIGSDPDVDFAIAEAPSSSFPLVTTAGGVSSVHFTSDMSGSLEHGGERATLGELVERKPRGRPPVCRARSRCLFRNPGALVSRLAAVGSRSRRWRRRAIMA